MKKIFKLFLALVCVPAFTNCFAQAPTWYWAKSGGLTGEEFGYSVAMDKSGNVYAAGSYTSATLTFGAITLTNAGMGDAFLVKFNSTGNILWAKNIGGSAGDVGHGVAVDAAGNIYVAGWYASATLSIGNTTLTNAGTATPDVFIAKYDVFGNELWAKSIGGPGIDLCSSIAVDAGINLTVAGRFTGVTALIGSVTLTNASAGTNDIFIAEYDSSGAVSWAKSMGGTGDDIGECVAADASGNSYLSGSFTSASIMFGTQTLTNAGTGNDMFVAKFDNSGNVDWAKSAGSTGAEIGYGVAVDGNGNVLVTGLFDSPVLSFGANLLNNSGYSDFFLAKYDISGNVIWANSAGGPYDDAGLSVSADSAGSIYVTGKYSSATISFGTAILTNSSAGTQDLFVAKLDPSGNEFWSISAGSTGDEIGNGIIAGGDANVYVTGVFNSGMFILGQTTLYKGCGNDFFIAVLSNAVGIPEINTIANPDIFPNPTEGDFSLSCGMDDFRIDIFSELGKRVYSENRNSRSSLFDISGFRDGIYFFRITDNKSDPQGAAVTYTGKIIVK